MPESDKTPLYIAWANIVIKIWEEKILLLGALDSGALYESLKLHVQANANGEIARIDFFYKLYGKFVDMGVGREISRGNRGDLGFTPTRRRKEWYSRIFYREVMKLKELVAARYGEDAAREIASTINAIKDLKYNEYKRM